MFFCLRLVECGLSATLKVVSGKKATSLQPVVVCLHAVNVFVFTEAVRSYIRQGN